VALTEEASRELGLDWTYADGHLGLFQPLGNAIRDLSPDSRLDGLTTYPGTGQVFFQGVGTLPREFFVRLNALVVDGNGTILANPRTVATSGRESMIQIRKTLNYFFNEGYDTAGRPIVKKSDISADTQGQITPTLLADDRIHMTVDVKVGSFTFTPDAGLPEQVNRQSTTEVTVGEGETLVIGGLRQQETSNSTIKVPLLGDIPLLGALFRKTQKEVRNSVLTLFITPHVLREGQPAPEWPQLDPNDHTLRPIMPEPK
jgi:type II secretory pathway component GspD/PulD (secretin)